MRTVEIIDQKRNGQELTPEQISHLIEGYCSGRIPDYQMAAFAMAVVWQGMTIAETEALTRSMIASGDTVSLKEISKPTVDKHSTGGVGDKTTLVVGPLATALGVAVPKLSGRGLGHTGGTLDKLESIPGFRTRLELPEFIATVNKVGMAVASPTANLVPADQLLYALRDATATVRSLPLIASSIMSKKLAVETDAISLDVKVGEGAFFRTLDEAREFSKIAVELGSRMGRKVHCMLTSMDSPLGRAIGNSIEVKEAIDTLHGNGPSDFTELCLSAATTMVSLLRPAETEASIREQLEKAVGNGTAFTTFVNWITAQGGSREVLENPGLFEKAGRKITVPAPASGVVQKTHALALGNLAMALGAGRETKEQEIDHTAGIYLERKPGEKVQKGEPLATLYTNREGPSSQWEARLLDAFEIGPGEPYPIPSPILEGSPPVA